MSIGYMPKKLKYARRQRRMRKKYKNFSCTTCADNPCWRRSRLTPFGAFIAVGNVEFCPYWSASDDARRGTQDTTYTDDSKKKRTLKEILRDIF